MEPRHAISDESFDIAVQDGLIAAVEHLPIIEADLAEAKHRGDAFEHFVATLILRSGGHFEGTAMDSITGGSGDMGCDLWFEQPEQPDPTLLIVQTTHTEDSRSEADPDHARKFFKVWSDHRNPTVVEAKAKPSLKHRLLSIPGLIDDGWNVEYRYVTNAVLSQPLLEDLKRADEEAGDSTSITAFDYENFKALYCKAVSMEADVPKEVQLRFEVNKYLDLENAVVGVIKGCELEKLLIKEQQSLFSYNVRSFLGNNQVNKGIKKTAKETPESFLLMNNGVVALATSIEFKEIDGEPQVNLMIAKDFQIINGAQTVSSLPAGTDQAVELAIKVVRVDSVNTSSGLNAKIIEASNTQNAIKGYELRSNDKIHQFLEENFQNLDATIPLRTFYYKRKTGQAKPEGTGNLKGLELSNFGLIRYAFLYDPAGVHKNRDLLWTATSGGKYEKVFGVKGVMENSWNADTMGQAKFAVAAYDWLAIKLKSDPSYEEYFPFKYHYLNLFGAYLNKRRSPKEIGDLLANEVAFKQVVKFLFDKAHNIISMTWIDRKKSTHLPKPLTEYGYRQDEGKFWDSTVIDWWDTNVLIEPNPIDEL